MYAHAYLFLYALSGCTYCDSEVPAFQRVRPLFLDLCALLTSLALHPPPRERTGVRPVSCRGFQGFLCRECQAVQTGDQLFILLAL